MGIKIGILVVYFAIMVGIGLYYWITAGMGHIREKNAYYDAAFRFSDHAGIFWIAF